MNKDQVWVLVELMKVDINPLESVHTFGSLTALEDAELMKDEYGKPLTYAQLRARLRKTKEIDRWENEYYALIKKEIHKSKRYESKK